jgi:hypothetical protein
MKPELIITVLDSIIFVLQRIQASILKAFNNPTTKTADDETRKKVKGMLALIVKSFFLGENIKSFFIAEKELSILVIIFLK